MHTLSVPFYFFSSLSSSHTSPTIQPERNMSVGKSDPPIPFAILLQKLLYLWTYIGKAYNSNSVKENMTALSEQHYCLKHFFNLALFVGSY